MKDEAAGVMMTFPVAGVGFTKTHFSAKISPPESTTLPI
jgi:hypothetical protein